jgi:hypothetical protein
MAAVFSGKAEPAGAARGGAGSSGRAPGSANPSWSGMPRAGPPDEGRRPEAGGVLEPERPRLSIMRPCEPVSISRSACYGPVTGAGPPNPALMRPVDGRSLEAPWYGARRMARHLRRRGHAVAWGRKRVGARARPPADGDDGAGRRLPAAEDDVLRWMVR